MPRNFLSALTLTLINIGCAAGISAVSVKKAIAAEEIYLNYGPLEFSLTVEALEAYAQKGIIKDELQTYAGYLTPAQLETLKVGLTTSADLSHLAIAQFLYSYQGEKILERVGNVIQTKAYQSGFYAIRSALILAAADEEAGGLTPLNVLRKFPTKGIRIDSAKGFKIIEDLSKILQKSNQAISAVEAEAETEAETVALVNKTNFPNLLRPGYIRYRKQLLTMRDRDRQRSFPVSLYIPDLLADRNNPLPLVVISHGLGSDRTTFEYFARHLATQGFAVAVPEHPGSNASQIQNLLSGLDNDVTPPKELLDRPLDIQFLLDRLTEDYGKRIDTQNVGIIGQSFGAYTALALSGAELNFESLERDCANLDESWNISLLLQCLALELPYEPIPKLKDERIVAAIAINPLTSALFGKESLKEIDIPVMLVSGSADPITPALSEQIVPFTWLATEEKYLALLKGGTHFSTLNESSGSIPVPERAIGPDPKIAQDYIKQLGLAFFGAYVTDNSAYRGYLNANYGNYLSNEQMPLSLVRSLEEANWQLKP